MEPHVCVSGSSSKEKLQKSLQRKKSTERTENRKAENHGSRSIMRQSLQEAISLWWEQKGESAFPERTGWNRLQEEDWQVHW